MNEFCTKILSMLKKVIKGLLVLSAVVAVLVAFYCGMDFIFKNFLSFTSRAVLSNFIVFAMIIFFVMRQAIHPKAMLEEMQAVVENNIKDSEVAKEESEKRLNSIEENLLHIDKEIDAILEKSQQNAKLVGEKILQDAENTALIVQDNTMKAIENAQTILKNDLVKRASMASVEVAKSHILGELINNQELHEKLINESIEALEGVEL